MSSFKRGPCRHRDHIVWTQVTRTQVSGDLVRGDFVNEDLVVWTFSEGPCIRLVGIGIVPDGTFF